MVVVNSVQEGQLDLAESPTAVAGEECKGCSSSSISLFQSILMARAFIALSEVHISAVPGNCHTNSLHRTTGFNT